MPSISFRESLAFALVFRRLDSLPEFWRIWSEIPIDNAIANPLLSIPIVALSSHILEEWRSADIGHRTHLVCFEQVLIGRLNRKRETIHGYPIVLSFVGYIGITLQKQLS